MRFSSLLCSFQKESRHGFYPRVQGICTQRQRRRSCGCLVIENAFNEIVKSVVNDVVMPPIGKSDRRSQFCRLKYPLGETPVLKDGVQQLGKDGQPLMNEAFIAYGKSIQTIINFLIIAFTVFCDRQGDERSQEANGEESRRKSASGRSSADIKLLTEIRDCCKKKRPRANGSAFKPVAEVSTTSATFFATRFSVNSMP